MGNGGEGKGNKGTEMSIYLYINIYYEIQKQCTR
jgi:hypothetical protein